MRRKRKPDSCLVHWMTCKPLTASENRTLARQYRDGSEAERTAARDAMIRGNQGLVVKEAEKFTRSLLDFEDRLQEGNFGLCDAIEGYDPERPEQFSTYAWRLIYVAIQRADRDLGNTIRVPAWLSNSVKRKEMNPELVADGQRARSVCSIHGVMPDGGSIAECLAARSDGVSLELKETIDCVRRAIKRLPANQRQAIRLRHGIAGREPQHLKAIGQALGGVSRERARQVLQMATVRLQRSKRLMEVAS